VASGGRHIAVFVRPVSGSSGNSVGLVGIWLATPPLPVAIATLGFSGWGVALPSIDTGVSGLVPAQFRADGLSFRGSTRFLGRAVDPSLFATLTPRSGYRLLLLLAGMSALVFGVAVRHASVRAGFVVREGRCTREGRPSRST